MNLWTLVCLAAYLGFIKASVGPQTPEDIAKARKALLYGDDEVMAGGISSRDNTVRNQDGRSLWRMGVVPYVISPDLEKHRRLILQAMNQYHKHTCIRFVPRTDQSNYVQLEKGERCSSFVGMIGGKQVISLGDGCYFIGTIVHELGHAIGLYHEHKRTDRDKYITIFNKNIKKDFFHNFRIKETEYPTPYNYDSIMHYGNYAFSRQPKRLKTMKAKNGQKLREPYEREGLHAGDIKHIRRLYKCRRTRA